MQFKYLWINIRKSVFGEKLSVQRAVLRRMYRAYSMTPVESLQMVTNTPLLNFQVAIKAMKIQQDTNPSR